MSGSVGDRLVVHHISIAEGTPHLADGAKSRSGSEEKHLATDPARVAARLSAHCAFSFRRAGFPSV